MDHRGTHLITPLLAPRVRWRRVCGCVLAGGLLAMPAYAWAAAGGAASPAPVEAEFNSAFLVGGQNIDISRFAHGNPVMPGSYRVDLYANGNWIGREDVLFRAGDDPNRAQACFKAVQLDRIGLDRDKLAMIAGNADECRPIGEWAPSAEASFDPSELRLDLSLPQALLRRSARGFVDPRYWDRGITAGTLGYSFNSFRLHNSGSSSTSSYLGLNAGLNVGDWQLRHNSTITWNPGQGRHFQNIATYAQRNLPSIRSQLTVGDANTNGEMFDSIAFRGAQLATDDRMLPDSLRGYAPVVRGVAGSNARVEIRQNGYVIYQTTVAPGPFEINDLYPTGYGGDLQVSVTEADGSVRRFAVPYASVAQMLRPGISRYNLTVGQVREDFLHDHPGLVQATVQRGLSNLLTGYGGVLGSRGYAAVLVGGAFNTRYGAFAVDLTGARTQIPGQGSQSGESLKLSYSKLLSETGTNLSVAAYRYSTSGYLGLRDALSQREYASRGYLSVADDLAQQLRNGQLDDNRQPFDPAAVRRYAEQQALNRQRSSFELRLSQPLGNSGSVYVTGSVHDYWNRGGSDTQYQAGYNNHFRSLSYSLSASRTRDLVGRSETLYYLTFSLPLGHAAHSPALNSNIAHSDRGYSTSQVGLTGNAGVDNNFNYGVTAGHDTRSGSNGTMNAQYAAPFATLSGSYGQGQGYRQTSVGVNGALVMHGGGVTFAPQQGETMAIVEAPEAKGAQVGNYSGLRIDSRGYAVIPYLQPYSLNTVEIDPKGLPADVELQSTSQQVAPYAGAVVKLKFATVTGRAVLIHALDPHGQPLPFAARVLDAQGNDVGVVGQASRLYVRGVADSGSLVVRLGEQAAQQCRIDYQLPPRTRSSDGLYQTIEARCVDAAVKPASERP